MVSDLKLVPEACFSAWRYSGYFGIPARTRGVALVGLMMLIGAGAGAGAGVLCRFKKTGVDK
ncbi:hypothetical protein [Vibrio mexicanus]|uniref:hypothetical protein n=1 Tax=Vibrio mexicanus TaxID=1004326 RepID=UPI00063CC1D4|nr:hypothetical protein [Vibrio mexicanus]